MNAPSIVVLDGHTLNPGDNPWDILAILGTLTVHDRTPASEVVARARGATVANVHAFLSGQPANVVK